MLSDSLLLDTLLLDSCYRTVQLANHIQSCSLNQPITFKVIIVCVRACVRTRALCFWRLIDDRRSDGLKCLHLLCRYLMRIFPFFHNLAILFSKILIFMINW